MMLIKKGENLVSFFFSISIVLVLVLQVTDTYKLILLAFDSSIRVASVLTLGINLAYIVFNVNLVIRLFKKKLFKIWLNLILIIPIVIISIHYLYGSLTFAQYVYWGVFQLLFGSLFIVSTIVFYKKNSSFLVNSFFGFALLSIIISFIVGYVDYGVLRDIMALSSETESYAYIRSESNRAIGFYTQHNLVARAILIFSTILLGTYFFNKSRVITYSFTIFCFGLILLTGSRTALILYLFFLIFYLPRTFIKKVFLNNDRKSRFSRYILYGFIPFISVILLFVLSISSDILTDLGFSFLSERVETINPLTSGENLSGDKSLALRVTVIGQYLDKIGESVLIGYGPALREEYISRGVFITASQNQFLEDMFAYGIPYTLYYLYVFIYTFVNLSWQDIVANKRVIFFKAFLVILFIYGFSVNYILVNRIIIITLGIYMGLYLGTESKRNKYF